MTRHQRPFAEIPIWTASLLLLLLPQAVLAYPLFRAPFLSFNTGPFPVTAAAGDLNGDGHPDFVTANPSYNNSSLRSVSVFLGTGNGFFGPRTDISSTGGANGVHLRDLNGDGKLDLLVFQGATGVKAYLGSGSGTFSPGPLTSAGSAPTAVIVSSFNADTIPDIAVAQSTGSRVAVLLGTGTGGFGAPTYFTTGNGSQSLAAGDLNGDGFQDLAVTSELAGTVSILLGTGSGSFGPKSDLNVSGSQYRVALAEMTGDGKLDLVLTSSTNSGTLSVYPGLGNGGFGFNVDTQPGGTPVICDVNGDGKRDVAFGSRVLLGNGDGTFTAPIPFSTGDLPGPPAVSDLNSDGKQDLVVPNNNHATVSVLLGNGDGTFGSPNLPVGGYPTGIASGDLNSDARVDLAVARGSVSLLMNMGNSTFAPATSLSFTSSVDAVHLSDLNHDGKLDLLAAFSNTGGCARLGIGDGTFGPQLNFSTGTSPVALAAGSLNGDANPDLIVANQGSNTISVFLGVGDGSFLAKHDYPTLSNPRWVAIGDLNNDGNMEVVVADYGSTRISVFPGDGSGTFTSRADYLTASGPGCVVLRDLNGDGKLDAAVACDASVASVLLGHGDGTFGSKTDFQVDNNSGGIVANDFDGDGKVDLGVLNALINSSSPNSVSILAGNGDGTFQAKVDYGTGQYPRSGVCGDFNGDGRWDIATANYAGGGTVTILANNADFIAGVPALPGRPQSFWISNPTPNPSPGNILIRYGLTRASRVQIDILDAAGRRAARVLDELRGPGTATVGFDGESLPSGVYLVRMSAGGETQYRRFAIVR